VNVGGFKEGEKVKLLDPNSGKLKLIGYSVNLEEQVDVNYEDARGFFPLHPLLNRLKNKAWNYIIINTPVHVIQLAFIDITVLHSAEAKVFEVQDPNGTLRATDEPSYSVKLNKRSIGDENAEYQGFKLSIQVTGEGDQKDILV